MDKIAVIGSRSFSNYTLLKRYLLDYFYPFVLVSGGASGADSLAERFAENKHLKKVIFRADWEKYGKRAGFLRNKKIIKKADIIVAFWDGKSKGTKMSIDLAKKQDKLVYIVMFPNE